MARIRWIAAAAFVGLLAAGAAWGQGVVGSCGLGAPCPGPATLGSVTNLFAGQPLGLSQGSLGAPGGSMTNYVAGDTITLQCTGVTFSTPPTVGVSTISGGAVTGAAVTNPGIVSNAPASGSISCSQASTSGTGTGYTVTASLGLNVNYMLVAALNNVGGATSSNGNLFLNIGAGDTPPNGFGGGENTFVGDKAGFGIKGLAQFNTALGHNSCGAGGVGTNTGNNTCIGTDAGRNIAVAATGFSTLIGFGAGENVANCCNTIIGGNAGNTNVTGGSNTLIGQGVASTTLTTGGNNVVIGTSAACDVDTALRSNSLTLCSGGTAILRTLGGATPATATSTLNGTLALANIGSDATHTDSTVCQDTTSHVLFAGSGAAGICLGTSSMRFKDGIRPMEIGGLAQIAALETKTFRYKPGYGDNGERQQVGFIAEQVATVLPTLVGPDAEGNPQSVDYMGIAVVMTKAIQELKVDNDNLRACMDSWKCRLFGWR